MSNQKEITNGIVSELVSTSVAVGHKRSKTHPKMKPYVAMTRNDIDYIDPETTLESIDEAVKFINDRLGPDDFVLCAASSAPAKDATLAFAKQFNFPYVVTRWLGGTLTNYKVISERMKHYVDLKAKKEKGELDKYTKKEQLKFGEEIAKLSINFDGLLKMTKLPAIVLVVDPEVNDTAVKEAIKLNIPVVAILDTNDDPRKITKPIFANDHTRTSIAWVLNKIQAGIVAGRKAVAK